MTQPHETPEFRNSAEYTVTVTFRVAGGARWQTAHRHARCIAERLANHAARAAQVVEVTAVGGPSEHGRPFSPGWIRFAAANSGRGTYADPDRLDRYLDPEFERALASLADARATAADQVEADRARRQALGCLNTHQPSWRRALRCPCAYCSPGEHEHALRQSRAGEPDPLRTPRCVCGRAVTTAGQRCARHVGLELVVLDADPAPLHRLASHQPPG